MPDWRRLVAIPAAIGVAALGAAWLLGRLKAAYYFRAFGVGLGEVELAFADSVFESWFVVQNLLYFVLLWWVVIQTRSVWAALVGVAYVPLPLAAHYAFAFADFPPAGWLIAYRHTLLKFVPFLVLLGAWWMYPERRKALRSRQFPAGTAGLLLFALVSFSWAISAAKHFGAYDAALAMREPERHLPRVRLRATEGASGQPWTRDGRQLYLLATTKRTLIVWDQTGFRFGESKDVRVLVVARRWVERLETSQRFEIQPGSRYL